MKNPIAASIDELIVEQIEYVNSLKDGSDEKAKANDELTKLYAMRKDETGAFKDKVKLILDGAGIVVSIAGLGISVWATKKGFKFEETGAFVSSTMKQLFGNVLKFNK